MAHDDDHYMKLPELAHYSGLSISTLQRYLKDPARPIPASRVGGSLLVLRSAFDAWMAEARETPRAAPAKVREAYQERKARDTAAWVRKLTGRA
jgi:predicted DNA-binding transcriptional regulator AlpA